jgi:GxxExxY protein
MMPRPMADQDYKHAELTERLIGIFFEVYNELGHGFLESVYEQAYVLVLTSKGIQFQQQCPGNVMFRGANVGEFRADLIAERAVIVEMKAVQKLDLSHEKQLLNYLRATNLEVGLLLNFGPSAQIRRLVLENERKRLRRSAAGSSL